MMVPIKIGSDPEAFVRDKRNGKIVSVHNMLPGTKKEPYKVPGGAIQVDGVAAEINIDPVDNSYEWIANHKKVLKEVQYYLGTSYELVFDPVAFFPSDYFKLLPPETQALGCDPDYNAWSGAQNPPPNSSSDYVKELDAIMRTASGHIHVGWTSHKDPNESFHRRQCFEMVKRLDASVGTRLHYWEGPDSIKRRVMYGKLGACRVKSYGVEYRVPSNEWLKSEAAMTRIYNATMVAARRFFLGATVKKDEYEYAKSKLA